MMHKTDLWAVRLDISTIDPKFNHTLEVLERKIVFKMRDFDKVKDLYYDIERFVEKHPLILSTKQRGEENECA